MRKLALSGVCAAALAAVTAAEAPAQPVPSPDQEFRGAWVSRFEWPAGSEAATKSSISSIMQTLADHNFNAVLFQIRGQMDVLYPSPYEPWGHQFGWTDPGWDPLQYAIDEAHANGLEFHAYINTHTLRANLPPANTTPQHRYNLHGPDAEDSWVIHGPDGQPVAFTDSYTWLSPGHPDAEAWTRRAINHVVENYNVDGIHFDRIRTPTGDFSHDPRTLERFHGDGNPDGEEFGDFMRSQITRQLRRIYGATMLRNPDVKVSAAPFGIAMRVPGGYQGTGTQSYYSWKQDSFGWMQNRVLDFMVPMIYWDIGSAHPFEVLLNDFLQRDGGRHIVAGSITSRDYIEQVYETRRQNAPGQVIFSMGSANFSLYSSGPYQAPVPVPDMPWKTDPQDAIIVGTVTNGSGAPLLDVRINRDGDSYNYLTGADGFYAVLNVPPGTYTVTANKTGMTGGSATIEVEAGDVKEVDFVLLERTVQVAFGQDVYYNDDTATLTVRDPNIPSGEDEVTAAITSDSQPEPLPVTLTRVSEMDFSGTFALSPEAGGAGLHAEPGDQILASYDSVDGLLNAEASVDVYLRVFHEPLLATPTGFTLGEGWESGEPTGASGTAGGPGPDHAVRGSLIYGYNLAGGYEPDLPEPRHLTTPNVDLSAGHDTRIRFQRWLQAGPAPEHGAALQASHDGNTWFTVWTNPEAGTADTEWNRVEYPVGRWMDGRPAVWFRWAMGPNDAAVSHAGWHLDDIEVRQLPGRRIGWILDDGEPGFSVHEDWSTSSWGDNYGPTKHYTGPGDGSTEASWTFAAAPPGHYTLSFWVNRSSYAAEARYRIFHDNAPAEGELVTASQNFVDTGWHELGTFPFTSGEIRITVSDDFGGPGSYVVADALRALKEQAIDITTVEHEAWLLH